MLTFASVFSEELVDRVYTIPADEWRYVDLGIRDRVALVEAEYAVTSGSDQVRLAVMRRSDLELLREGLAHGAVGATEPGRAGKLRCEVRPPGEFVAVVDNRMSEGRAAEVRLRIRIQFSSAGDAAEQLSPRRRMTVILVSFAVFFGVVTWSGRKLLPTFRR